jgi:hypothetical protein
MGWTIWDKAPIVSCAIITAIQLFNLIQKQIILSDADITHISELRALYLKHCNKLEKLWTEFRAGRQTEKQASDAFFKLRNEADKIEKLDTKLDVKQRNFLKKKADLEVRTYVKQYHS